MQGSTQGKQRQVKEAIWNENDGVDVRTGMAEATQKDLSILNKFLCACARMQISVKNCAAGCTQIKLTRNHGGATVMMIDNLH